MNNKRNLLNPGIGKKGLTLFSRHHLIGGEKDNKEEEEKPDFKIPPQEEQTPKNDAD